MPVNFCPQCGTPKRAPDARICFSCGLLFSSVGASLAHMDNARAAPTISRGRAAVVAIATFFAAIAFAWLQYYTLFTYSLNEGHLLLLVFFLAPLSVVAGFWYGILRLAQVQAPRVYLETFIFYIMLLIIPYHVVVEILSLIKDQGSVTFTTSSALLFYVMNIGIMVAIGSLIGIALASFLAPWDALRQPQATMPKVRTVVAVYGSLLTCIIIELWTFLQPDNSGFGAIGYGIIVIGITLLASIIFPLIGCAMALSAL